MFNIMYADVSPLNNETIYAAAYDILPPFRQKKADSLRHRKDKNLSVGAWLVLKIALGKAGWDIDELEFDVQKGGKPYIINKEERDGIYFSLSHSGNIALAAVSDCLVGADIEESGSFNPDICRRFFKKAEQDAIFSLLDEERQGDMFFRIWTLKESYVKMTGKGISGFSECEILPGKPTQTKTNLTGCCFNEYEALGCRIGVCSLSDEAPSFERANIIKLFT